MHPGPVGHRPLIGGCPAQRWEQQRLEPCIVEFLGYRPADAGSTCPAQISADGALAQIQALGDGPLREPVLKPRSQQRNNSRILRIDSLSAGILFPAVRQRVQALPSVENRRRRGPLHRHAASITSTGFDDHDRLESAITFHRIR